jgi:hypothetical protein
MLAKNCSLRYTRCRPTIQCSLKSAGLTAIEAVRVGQADGSATCDVDAEDASQEIVATGIGYAYLWIVTPDKFDVESTLAHWRNRVANSLRPRSGAHTA